MAKALGITGLRLRNWLRAEHAAGHPLLAGHHHGEHWVFSRRDADRLMAEYRASGGRPRSPGGSAPSARQQGGPRELPSAARRRSTRVTSAALDGYAFSDDPGHRATEEWMGESVLTLADLLRPGLRAVVVGINPSPVSVAAGHYYQGSNGRRWWDALREAGILTQGDGFEDDRLFAAGIGFTDLVKRATARETGLRPGEREYGRELLQHRLDGLGVERVLFVYKSSATQLLGRFEGWGLRPGRPVADARAWVMCGPMARREDRARAIRELRAWWHG